MGFATDFSDSLQVRIDQTQGLEKIDAQLELSYYYRRSDMEKARLLAEEALEQIQLNHKNDSMRRSQAIYCLALSHYYDMNYNKALDLLYQALAIAQKDQNDYLMSELYFFIGASNYFHFGDNSQAINFYNQSVHYGLRSDNYRTLGAVYSALSSIFRVSGSYEKSLEFAFKSKEYYGKSGYLEGIAWSEYIAGSLFRTTGLYEEAEAAFTRSHNIYRELAAKDNMMTGVALCLDQLAVVHRILGNWETSYKYIQEALAYNKQDGSKFGISNSLKYWGELELSRGNYKLAESLLDSSLTMKKELEDKIGSSGLYADIGALFIEKKEYQRAVDSLMIGMKYAIENEQISARLTINKHLATAYKELGQYDKAYLFKSEEIAVADSIYNLKTTRNMLQLETLFELELKDNEIKQLEQDKLITELSLAKQKQLQLYFYIIISFALLIILLFIYFLRSKVKSNHELIHRKQEIEMTNATKDKFFSILSHDLRNPYNSILGISSILKNKHRKMSEDERDKLINTLYQSSHNNYALLNSLLEWSRSQRGMISYHPESFVINEIAESVYDLMRNMCQEKGLEVVIDHKPVSIVADKNMIHTIFRNLLSNAIKYSHPNSKIEIYIDKDNRETHVRIKDYGIGISNEDLNRLFKIDSDFQIDGTAGEKGTGLGLVVCQDFIEQHHGKIWAESEAGSGSTFHFTIPNAK
jgi:signal transduction histidine kinase